MFVLFRNKAFDIDDPTFLSMSKHMLVDPLHPASVQIVVNGRPPDWISNGMWSGPVMPALLLPSVAAGGVEWLAHLSMLLVFLVGIVATAVLALRLSVSDKGARWAAVLVTTSPAVLAMASTAMPDVPTMSFAVLGVERLVAFRVERRWWQGVSASVALALSTLSRQHGVLTIGCALLIVLLAWPSSARDLWRRITDKVFLACVGFTVVAVVMVVALYQVMRDDHATLAATPMRIADLSSWRINLANLPAQWVLSFPLGLCWLWLRHRQMSRSWWCYLGAAVGVYLAWQTQVVYCHHSWMWWQAPVTALGTAALVDAVVDAVKRRDVVDLGLAVWLFIALPIAVYTHLPPKYLVPSAPAMAILLARQSGRAPAPVRLVLGSASWLGVLLALLIVRADEAHAGIGRAGGEIVARYVARGETVWLDGTWGFQWYAMQAGATPMTTVAPRPKPGDIVVVGAEGRLMNDVPNKTLLEHVTFHAAPGRTMHKPAGFYSNVSWGPLPWIWTHDAFQPIVVWRVTESPTPVNSTE
jgi:4-amino-4-deoxy-L-arabinose transferase-like glycosyltransferase